MRKNPFIPGEYYHIYGRILFNAPEFKNEKNAERLMQAFLLANSEKSSEAFQYLRNNKDENGSFKKSVEIAKKGEKFVDIICYVIMPDHYHLLLRERTKNGISRFIHKCNISVSKYINIKNNRRGPLFENRFNAKHVGSNDYLLHLSLYIHLNPLDFLADREWRKNRLKNWPLAKKKLFAYKWSSIKSFLQNNYTDPILSGTDIIKEQFNSRLNYEDFLDEWPAKESSEIINILID